MPRAHPLPTLRIASPCDVGWDNMEGEGRARVCSKCANHVYDLTELSSKEAQELITEHQGRFCAHALIRRRDGTVMTGRCPSMLARAERASHRAVSLVAGAAVFVAVAGAGFLATVPVLESNECQSHIRVRSAACIAKDARVKVRRALDFRSRFVTIDGGTSDLIDQNL